MRRLFQLERTGQAGSRAAPDAKVKRSLQTETAAQRSSPSCGFGIRRSPNKMYRNVNPITGRVNIVNQDRQSAASGNEGQPMKQSAEPIAVGIDIGGSRIKSTAINIRGDIVHRMEQPTVAVRESLIQSVHCFVEELSVPPAAIGIASPGLASPDNSRIIWMQGRLDAVEGLAWASHFPAVPVVRVLNDAHAATLGEAWVGAAAGKQHVLLLTLGTGVGGGVIADGRLLQGRLGRAGHLGHICLDWHGAPDIVRTPGSFEDLVGDHTVSQRSGGQYESTDALVEAAAAGELSAKSVWSQTILALACGVTSLINCFDPEMVVIGGGIAKAGDLLFKPLRSKLGEIEWRPTGESVEIVPACLGEWSGSIGAAKFALDALD